MRIRVLLGVVTSAILVQPAFAENLGVLNDGQQPSQLISASEFANQLDGVQSQGDSSESMRSYAHGGGGGGGHGGGGGGGGGHSGGGHGGGGHEGGGHGGGGYGWYGYPSYYYPSYYYPYSYCYNYPYCSYYYYSDVPSVDSLTVGSDNPQGAAGLSNVLVGCFATDSEGHWYSSIDRLSNTISNQENVNRECLLNSGDCHQNLGCALAVFDN